MKRNTHNITWPYLLLEFLGLSPLEQVFGDEMLFPLIKHVMNKSKFGEGGEPKYVGAECKVRSRFVSGFPSRQLFAAMHWHSPTAQTYLDLPIRIR